MLSCTNNLPDLLFISWLPDTLRQPSGEGRKIKFSGSWFNCSDVFDARRKKSVPDFEFDSGILLNLTKKPSMRTFIIFSVVIWFSFGVLAQNVEGQVLKKELAGKYEGPLKKGLANGEGTAIGTDSYTGHFVKGLPEGEGTYSFSNGDVYQGSFSKGVFSGKGKLICKKAAGDSIVEGYWESGKYVGKEFTAPYEVSNKTGSVNPSIIRSGDGNRVEIVVLDPFNAYVAPQIIATGEYTQQNYYSRNYFADAKFPLTFDIRYSCTNKYRSGFIDSTIRIKINKPGSWVVTLRN
jgi:hypothetical protein